MLMTQIVCTARSFLIGIALFSVAACGGSSGTDGAPSMDAGGAAAEVGDGGAGGDNAGSFGASSDAGTPACSDKLRPIFVLTKGTPATIQSFDPKTLTFAEVIKLNCPNTASWEAESMAVDRNYGAWIEWRGKATGAMDPAFKRLDRVDLATGACDANVGSFPKSANWGDGLGMAFVSDASGGSAETLFFVDPSTKLYTLGSAALGEFFAFGTNGGGSFSAMELSGTGGGRLFAMIMNWTPEWNHPCTANNICFPTVHIGEVNRADGSAVSNKEIANLPAFGIDPGGFAFAHWGGSLWVFESLKFGPTKVYSHDPAAGTDPKNGTATLVKSDGPSAIVGAGVSTCAPTSSPK